MDDDYLSNATQLSIARTVIHESVHAFIGFSLNLNRTTDLASDLSQYRMQLLTSGNNYSQAELDNLTTHNFMAQYVEAIGHSLSVWGNRVQDEDYYNNLAWSGDMLNSDSFKKLPLAKRKKIEKANRAEGNAIQKATNNALGLKCN